MNLPSLVKISQGFDTPAIADLPRTIAAEFARTAPQKAIKPVRVEKK